MSEYTDIQLINCNRSASIEGRADLETNTGLFTNPLNQSVILDVGDMVSVEHAFINEVGAGQSQPIEFQGSKRLQDKWNVDPAKPNEITYTKITPSKKITDMTNDEYRMGYYRAFQTEETQFKYVPKDNEANITIGYYITSSDHPEYMNLPRRFASLETNTGSQSGEPLAPRNAQGTDPDYLTCGTDFMASTRQIPSDTNGLTIEQEVFEDNYCGADWIKYAEDAPGHTPPFTGTNRFRMRIDNSRFTLYSKDYVDYSLGGSVVTDLNLLWIEPKYYRYRELKTLNVGEGFNTPESIAKQLTSQLNEQKSNDDFRILDTPTDDAGTPTIHLKDRFERSLVRTIDSTTFKPFNCANYYETGKLAYDEAKSGTYNVLTNKYQASITQFIAVKRPEIWEAGRDMFNSVLIPSIAPTTAPTVFIGQNKIYDGIGIYNDIQLAATNFRPIVLQLEYTQDNLIKLSNFFKSQKLYPEMWEGLHLQGDFSSDTTNFTPENTRFLHMNRYMNTLAGGLRPVDTPTYFPVEDPTKHYVASFGSGCMTYHASPSAFDKENIGSGAVFFEYDETTEDTYYEPTDVKYVNTLRKLSMGFAQAVRSDDTEFAPWGPGGNYQPDTPMWLICIRTDYLEGIGASFFTDLSPDGMIINNIVLAKDTPVIRVGRRCGFDFNLSAFSTSVICPYSGTAPYSMSVDVGDNTTDGTLPADPLIIKDIPMPIWTNALVNTRSDGVVEYETSHTATQPKMKQRLTPTIQFSTQVYMGANSPVINYDSLSNRFSFSRFHTANNRGNDNFLTGMTQSNSVGGNIDLDEEDVVYKINPTQNSFGFSPVFMPYSQNKAEIHLPITTNVITGVTQSGDGATPQNDFKYTPATLIQNPIEGLDKNKIFDSHGGIYIDSFGIKETDWKGCIWDTMGFTYEQLNSVPTPTNTLNNRITNNNKGNIYRLTTNADIEPNDIKNWTINPFGAGFFNNSIQFPQTLYKYAWGRSATGPGYQKAWETKPNPGSTNPTVINAFAQAPMGHVTQYPQIIEKTESIIISAVNLPKSMTKPYYSIHSSLISNINGIGGGRDSAGTQLPIMSICSKFDSNNDYFFTESSLEFTITKKSILSDVRTEIRNPDGTIANVDQGSSVIYKILRNQKPPEDIIKELIKK